MLDWSAKGDYRERPKGIFFNFADPAERRRRRELQANTRGQGVSALGAGANPTVLALDKSHRDAEAEAADAGQFEADVAAGVGKAAAVAGDLSKMDQARRMGILNTTAGLWGAELSRPKQPSWWERLLGGMQGNAEAAAAAGL